MKGSLELPEDYEDDLRLGWIHLTILISTILFFTAYYYSYILGNWLDIDSGFAKFYPFINIQFKYMMGDWQIVFAVISILLITLGWSILKALAIGYIHLQVGRGREFNRMAGFLVRYGIAEYFLALLLSNLIFSFEFNQLMLWFSAGIIFSSLFFTTYGLLWWRNKRFMDSEKYQKKREEAKWLGLRESDTGDTFITVKQIIFLILVCLAILSFIMFFPIFLDFWAMIHSDEIIAILFWVSILLIWPLWKITSLVLNALAKIPIYIVRGNLNDRVNRIRLYFGIFVVSLFAYANIPYFQSEWGLTDLQTQLLTLCLSLVTTVFSYYVTRGLKEG